ncbi:uncharacterized protein LOC105180640 [Harpegnathos saltator]|uniref:uncharacterized protein LOC105180640 n=1 Tax=Harpegnathos saltator TaxID=610380 RepID=UPI000DBEE3CE|nr:uncharacterized protein LOC105180640 [Harpegnathos saltator]
MSMRDPPCEVIAIWGSSYIDVTLASPVMSRFVGEWKVREAWTTSDHNSLDRLRVPKVRGKDQRALTTVRFDVSRADWESFAESLTDLSRSRLEILDLESARDEESFAKVLIEVFIEASGQAMPRKRRFRKSNPWWTKELTILKKDVYRKRRALQQESDMSARLVAQDKEQELAGIWLGNSEPWGFVYKHAAQKLRVDKILSSLRTENSSTATLEETAGRLLEVHVPEDRKNENTPEQRGIRESVRIVPDTNDAPFFKEAEIVEAAKSLKSNKAPGLDLLEVAVVRAASRPIPGKLFEKLLKE